VVVRDGVVVGEGWTQPPGQPHAEVMALHAAGAHARGADLYATLEPCTFWGRTPPCTDAIRAAGIRRVFFATRDPDPRIGHGAAATLHHSDVEVTHLADYAAAADEQMAAFRCWTTQTRPLVIGKYAMTLDGKIATHTGDSRWVSGPAARRRVHLLRDQVDAILVGVNTVLNDNPQLTTRLPNHWRPVRHPLRVILDSRGRTPLDAQVLAPHLPGRTVIATVSPTAWWQQEVAARGAEVLRLRPDEHGRVDLHDLLHTLAARNITSVLVEGGAAVLGSFAAAKLIDRLWAFIAPKLVGGTNAPGPVGDGGVALMADAQRWRIQHTKLVGDDLFVIAAPHADNQASHAEPDQARLRNGSSVTESSSHDTQRRNTCLPALLKN
jgi:diaminohydroxyphosphoribosylaminopyrimidine deaminase/5-amino-6-(5-phosphoribosylamino)uracil reductase